MVKLFYLNYNDVWTFCVFEKNNIWFTIGSHSSQQFFFRSSQQFFRTSIYFLNVAGVCCRSIHSGLYILLSLYIGLAATELRNAVLVVGLIMHVSKLARRLDTSVCAAVGILSTSRFNRFVLQIQFGPQNSLVPQHATWLNIRGNRCAALRLMLLLKFDKTASACACSNTRPGRTVRQSQQSRFVRSGFRFTYCAKTNISFPAIPNPWKFHLSFLALGGTTQNPISSLAGVPTRLLCPSVSWCG
jgi:hypothetical protein